MDGAGGGSWYGLTGRVLGPEAGDWWQWAAALCTSAANRLIGEVVQSRRGPLLGPSPG